MSGRDTDPRAFVLDPKVLAQVADQGAADRARAKIEADVELKKAVEGFSAEGSLPPYMPEAGSKIAVEMIAPGAAPPSREEEPAIPTETAPSSVVIAPEVFAAPVLPGAPAEVAQEPSPGSEQNDVLVSLAPAPAHNTTRKLQKPPGATAFLKAGAPDASPPAQDEGTQKNQSRKLVVLALITFAILGGGLWTYSWMSGPTVGGAAASNGVVTSPPATGAPKGPAVMATGALAPSVVPPSAATGSAATASAATASPPEPSTTVQSPSASVHPDAPHTAAPTSFGGKVTPAASGTGTSPAPSPSGSAWKPNW